mgnify:CR=1 FL=1
MTIEKMKQDLKYLGFTSLDHLSDQEIRDLHANAYQELNDMDDIDFRDLCDLQGFNDMRDSLFKNKRS